ncbi:MAG: SRPBCC domain-containing protein [Lacisediminihabitans sp.]
MELVFERELELPRTIVWDALVDAELVAGWLGEATIDAVAGGRYDLAWLHTTDQPPTSGIVSQLREHELLVVTTDNHGTLGFHLEELAGGTRGSSTRLRLAVRLEIEAVFAARVRANWMVSLDQLEELLRGHPVDWANWDRDHGAAWSQYRDRFSFLRG